MLVSLASNLEAEDFLPDTIQLARKLHLPVILLGVVPAAELITPPYGLHIITDTSQRKHTLEAELIRADLERSPTGGVPLGCRSSCA